MSKRGKILLAVAVAVLALGAAGACFMAYRISSRVLETPASPAQPGRLDPQSVHGFAFEDVEFATSDGLTLRGWLVRPAAPASAGAVLSHGRGGSRRSWLWLLPALRAKGLCSLLYDTRGSGGSDRGPIGGGFNGGHRDIIAAAQLVEERCAVDRVAAIGMSQGASNSITAAAQSERIDAVVAFGAGPNLYAVLRAVPTLSRMPDWMIALVTRISLYRMGLPADRVLDIGAGPIDRVETIAPRALMLVHGSDDAVVPVGQAGRLYARAKAPKRFWVIQGGGHGGFQEKAGDELYRRVLGFLTEHLDL